ncbi:hypothetical protein GUITHDRAFT_160759 [Guillardia theta CCMP2712]|uniref:Uncharacterized protein n=1 Tax=Guillardia theta (strain CCMP2712) TaxID=905079 RepID=L1K0S7_GUITC|nr:hypothetical protein GUITHDRAFT_160759 [Guillardia theta CCMP2712]EKX53968.1 hypothetical protein GUITHDRAFT_160759 [Guillardia theta CCMP2712]|eukprot:XP_005840948.1 hypothetical protein GUITHDRAFT_160759 [Guillardia theta CCMP2712]
MAPLDRQQSARLGALACCVSAAVCLTFLSAESGQSAKDLKRTSLLEATGARGLDNEWLGLPSKTDYYSDDWNSEESPDAFADDWEGYGHTPYSGRVLSVTGSGWERYPYGDLNAYIDGGGVFNNADLDFEVGKEGWTGKFPEGEPEGAEIKDRYSYFWPVENGMGYPEDELPARRTYEFDVSSGGRSYDSFWGGKDQISDYLEKENDFFRHSSLSPEEDTHRRLSFDQSTDQEKANRDTDGYKGFWREDIDLGGGLAGASNEDVLGDDGLIWTYRKAYNDDRAYDYRGWQHGDDLPPGVKKMDMSSSWPWQLFNYAGTRCMAEIRLEPDRFGS